MLEQAHFVAKVEGRKKKDEIPEEERILRESRQKQLLITRERDRIEYFRIRYDAAIRIQKAWKMYKFRAKGLMKNARESVRQKRLDAGELEWRRQIAACTIQLAWRKYYRRRLLASLERDVGCYRRAVHMWDPKLISAKQRSLVEQIYGEHLYAPDWHPQSIASERPLYMRSALSPAALSFNFAVEQYQPMPWLDGWSGLSAGGEYASKRLSADVERLEAEIQRDLVCLGESPARFSVLSVSHNLRLDSGYGSH